MPVRSLLTSLQDASTKVLFGSDGGTDKTSFYDIVDKDMQGNEVKMEAFKGDVLCVVNVASNEALTKANYVQFSKLYDALNSQGLKILAFPCNQFGAQEPGTHEEILNFVESKFGAKDKFTWFEKGHVNGANTREVYSFLKEKLPSDDGTKDIRWNFAKFLIDHEGTPVKRYGPKTNPDEMVADIEELLAKRNGK
eukprot:CAMPEP_0201690914 /NCGR_PEP_ID=MMETSP0578-20130828/4222_1 /ASSEMBLY_ACC=CAM_ASM_000663 /TAXON_ID=267565 /ORGANISM="Skeletonema grethea, Strain CCMP 1804" /LENGTH=194 /DNA_ID=CAMNT_0048176013 /DNA_START=88 /DNA_END=672 /DNA_ORIENTATION=+